MIVSFLHSGDATWASYRYRAAAPAAFLGASLNDPTADCLVFSKPMPGDLDVALAAIRSGRRVLVDYCDDHFDTPGLSEVYRTLAKLAEACICPTETMATRIRSLAPTVPVHVIPEPYETPEAAPHCAGTRLLWFGHRSNLAGLERLAPWLAGYPLTVLSNAPETTPWTPEALRAALTESDIVILPATSPHKSANRAIEAIRAGCCVLAEPHPATLAIPDVWSGHIPRGIRWAVAHPEEANARTALAQAWIRDRYAPQTIGEAWRQVCAGTPPLVDTPARLG